MINWLAVLFLIIKKELAVESRGRELVTLLGCTAIVVAGLIGAGISSAVLDSDTTRKLFSTLLLVVFLLTTTMASARASEAELESRGFEGLILAGVSGPQIYLAKVFVSAALFLANWLLLLILMGAALGQSLSEVFLSLLAVGAGCSLAIASLVVLMAGIAGTSKLRGVVLPLLTLPLLFPTFFAGLEMTTECVLNGSIAAGSIWPGVLIVTTTIFGLVGINSFDVIIID